VDTNDCPVSQVIRKEGSKEACRGAYAKFSRVVELICEYPMEQESD